MASESHGDERFESPEVRIRTVLLNGLGVLLLLMLAIWMLGAVYYWQVPVQSFPAPEQFPAPRVQTGQRQQLQRLESEQESRLTSYRWLDQKQGLVQIPIERAMQILAAEGMQAYAPLAPAQALSSPSAGAERLMTPQTQSPPASAAGGSSAPPAPATTTGSDGQSKQTPAAAPPAAGSAPTDPTGTNAASPEDSAKSPPPGGPP
jgi:hypothetical protein